MSEEVVFEGDEFTRGATRSGSSALVQKSSVTDFLLRRRVVKSERQARWLAVGIAALSIVMVAAATSWATRTLGATPDAKKFSEMSADERALLPPQHRLYLERIAREAAAQKEQEIREKFRSAEPQ